MSSPKGTLLGHVLCLEFSNPRSYCTPNRLLTPLGSICPHAALGSMPPSPLAPTGSRGCSTLPFSSSMQGAAPRPYRALTCWKSLGWFWAGHAGTCLLLPALGALTRRLLGTLDAAVHCGIQPSDSGVEKVQVRESPGSSRFLLPSLALGMDTVSRLHTCPSCSNNQQLLGGQMGAWIRPQGRCKRLQPLDPP